VNANDYYSILQGAIFTVSLSIASLVIGIPLGLGLALIRWAKTPLLNGLAQAYVNVIRSCPAVTLVLLIYYAMPEFGVSLNPLPAAVLALTMSTTAFNCEIWRSALVEFPKDQLDAANALGLNRFMRLRLIVFPQIWRASLPGIFNEITLQIKSTPAVAVIGIVEITRAALRVGSNTYEPLPPFIFALLIYSSIVYVFLKLQKFFELRMKDQGYI
jgi:His/Glu/Gln/Arg/opine family amino acid ABC transporter permease subunit